jgi:hypothetical protein
VAREVAGQTGTPVPLDDLTDVKAGRPEDIRSMVFAGGERAGRIPLTEGVRLTVEALRKELGQ